MRYPAIKSAGPLRCLWSLAVLCWFKLYLHEAYHTLSPLFLTCSLSKGTNFVHFRLHGGVLPRSPEMRVILSTQYAVEMREVNWLVVIVLALIFGMVNAQIHVLQISIFNRIIGKLIEGIVRW